MPVPSRSRSLRRGFTLIELMVVIVILGLLIGIVGKNVWHIFGSGEIGAAKTQMQMIGDAITLYQVNRKELPKTLEALTEEDPTTREPYIRSIPKDPWNQEYEYKPDFQRRKYEIVSGGKDGLIGTEDDLYHPERESK